jgi:SPP1 gp7 family putative phage head morphogenesis protein
VAGHFENGVWIEDPPGYEKPDIYIDPNKAAIDALVKRNLDLIDGLEDDVKNKMLTILSDGLVKGQGIDEIIRNMESAGVALGYAAERIARTEIMYALNQGALNRYKNDGIEYVQWLAGPDDRCCPVCLGYHLQVFPINDAPDIPAHPSCRCTLGPHFAEYNGRADREREQFEEDVESGKAPYNSNKWSDEDIRKWKEAGSKYENAPDEPILIQKEKKKRRGEKIP